MAKGYWVVMYHAVRDPGKLADYAAVAPAVIAAAGGRPLVRGVPAWTPEGSPEQRTVVIEFDSVARARAAYESASYQAARAKLGDSVDRDVRIVEEVP
jgi:uncharacterized protein (DUF1330 family)